MDMFSRLHIVSASTAVANIVCRMLTAGVIAQTLELGRGIFNHPTARISVDHEPIAPLQMLQCPHDVCLPNPIFWHSDRVRRGDLDEHTV